MKLYLICIFIITASTVFSMDIFEDPVFLENLETEARNPLFSMEEWVDIEIGHALLQDRVKQKQKILDYLKNPIISLEDKKSVCMADFGTVPYNSGQLNFEDSIRQGIDSYCKYISQLLDVYISAEKITKLLLQAKTRVEKEQHQNNLYYLLSFEIKYFRQLLISSFTHNIPEHSLEDNFYEMISSKMCIQATKKYDWLNKYIKISFITEGIKKQIDNKKLLDDYTLIHKKLIDNFSKNSPIFWLKLIDNKEIKNITDKQVNNISFNLQGCSKEVIEITSVLQAEINLYEESSLNSIENIISLYNTFGPLILDAIKSYEAVSAKIKHIEKDAIEWLKNFKEKNKLYRQIGREQKILISNYLQEQKIIKLNRLKEEHAAAATQAQKVLQRKPRKDKKAPAEKVLLTSVLHSRGSASAKEALAQPSTIAQTKTAKSESNFDDIIKNIPSNTETFISSQDVSPIEASVQPKIKVKTRPIPQNIPVIAIEEAEEKALPLMLPQSLRTEEFNYFIHVLLAENNDRKLIKLFKKLTTVYGVFSETNEQNNKGYFSIKSPITHKIHVRTYHHLHVDHPYASIFMAVRDVLIDAHIIER